MVAAVPPTEKKLNEISEIMQCLALLFILPYFTLASVYLNNTSQSLLLLSILYLLRYITNTLDVSEFYLSIVQMETK